MSLTGWRRHSKTQHPLPVNVSAVNHFRLAKPTASAHNRSVLENCSLLPAVLLIRKHAVFPCCRAPITTIYCGQPHFSDRSTPRGPCGPLSAVYHHRERPSRPPLPATPAVTDRRPFESRPLCFTSSCPPPSDQDPPLIFRQSFSSFHPAVSKVGAGND